MLVTWVGGLLLSNRSIGIASFCGAFQILSQGIEVPLEVMPPAEPLLFGLLRGVVHHDFVGLPVCFPQVLAGGPPSRARGELLNRWKSILIFWPGHLHAHEARHLRPWRRGTPLLP